MPRDVVTNNKVRGRRIRAVERQYEQFLNNRLRLCTLRELKKTLRTTGGAGGAKERQDVIGKLVEVSSWLHVPLDQLHARGVSLFGLAGVLREAVRLVADCRTLVARTAPSCCSLVYA